MIICANGHPEIVHTEAICPLCEAEIAWKECKLEFEDYKADIAEQSK